MNTDDEEMIKLQKAIARGEPLKSVKKPPLRYRPIYHHPLPVSDHRHERENALRRILCAHLEKQAAGAVSIGDAWVLEEIYMRGAPVDVPDLNGFTPLHLAVQMNNFECMLVLLNIGVVTNATTLSGFTPLYLSIATGSTQAENLLRERGARIVVETAKQPPGSTVLDLSLSREAKPSATRSLNNYLNLPHSSTWY